MNGRCSLESIKIMKQKSANFWEAIYLNFCCYMSIKPVCGFL